MGIYADIYAAIKTRSKKQALDFLNHFLPEREESDYIYEYPQFGKDTEREFKNRDELMTFLETNVKAEYNLYWKGTNASKTNKHAMLFYTEDESLIFGISCDADKGGNFNTNNEDECLKLMKEYFKTEIAYITYEAPPASTFKEFCEIVSDL